MNNLLRNKRPIYLCKQKIEDGRIFYENPIKIRVNYQPISDKSAGEILAVGQNYINRLIVYMRPDVAKNFHNFDRCYVFVEPPKEHDRTCSKADFYVDGTPSQYINESTVHFQRMTGDNDDR
jgi:hypothetical protein